MSGVERPPYQFHALIEISRYDTGSGWFYAWVCECEERSSARFDTPGDASLYHASHVRDQRDKAS